VDNFNVGGMAPFKKMNTHKESRKDKKKKEKKIEIWKLYPGPLRKWMKGLK
jgi:hypothetical protein